MKKLLMKLISVLDILLSPALLISAILLLFIRRYGVSRMKVSKKIFMKLGVFPIRDHYYEPLFNPRHLKHPLDKNRQLPGINFNIREQLDILAGFSYNNELVKFPLNKSGKLEFYYHNGFFGSGDAEYLYNIVRLFKPRKIIEIGSGYSTLMAINAIRFNRNDNLQYNCEHICIEPYEQSWLENTGAKIIRKRVEDIDKRIFSELEANDILFIDSSHIIRPQGDVLCEYLEILPLLDSGVIVHIHDIFTPKDYPEEWILRDVRLWNEQYLLESFLTLNHEYKIIGALNYLKHNYFYELASKCPILQNEPQSEPGSFWMMKN